MKHLAHIPYWLLILAAIIFWLRVPDASAAAFQVNDVCYPDAASALDAWKNRFPTPPDSNGAMWYVNAAAINATTGVITGTLKKSTVTTTTTITGVTLSSCTVAVSSYIFDKWPVNDLLFATVLVIVFIMGFGQGKAR